MNDTSGDTSSSTSSTGTGSTGTGTGTGIGSGELKSAWHRLCDTLRDSAGYVFDDQLGVSPSEQAEGLRHHLRLFTSTLQHSFESHDSEDVVVCQRRDRSTPCCRLTHSNRCL